MNKELRNFNIFVFISNLSRNMIELFIPIYLYKLGFTFESIIFYYLVVSIVSLIYSVGIGIVVNYIKHKYLIIGSALIFLIMYYLMNNPELNNNFLIILAITYSLYRRLFWIVNRYYAINVIDKKAPGLSSGLVTISTQLAVIISSATGAIILDNNNFILLSIISFILFASSCIPLFFIKESNNEKISFKEILNIGKQIPRNNLFIMLLYESMFYLLLLFPLYLFINIKGTYSFVGIFNLLVGISSIIFIFLFSKKMDKKKRDYLSIITFILFLIFILKLTINNSNIILLIAIFEGYFINMHNVAYNRNVWLLGTNFNTSSYNQFSEIIMGFSRLFLVLIFFIFKFNISTILMICIVVFAISGIFKFNNNLDTIK